MKLSVKSRKVESRMRLPLPSLRWRYGNESEKDEDDEVLGECFEDDRIGSCSGGIGR